MNISLFVKLLLVSTLLFLSCTKKETCHLITEKNNAKLLKEAEIIQIPLAGEVANRKAEISGLCWYKENLILLPQFPDRFADENGGKLFFIRKEEIQNYLLGKTEIPIEADSYSIDIEGFEDLFSRGSGFESITTNNNTAYFTVESANILATETLVITGRIDDLSKKITLDRKSLTKIASDVNIHNFSCESILFSENRIVPIYEANGANINPKSNVSILDTNINFQKEIKFPNIEYRITDATSVDNNNNFWVINYLFPRELGKLNPADDTIIEKYGIGESHFTSKVIERLVQFKIKGNEIVLANSIPIYIKLLENDSRNWEGIARLDDGFLIATDMFPKTILAFVKI